MDRIGARLRRVESRLTVRAFVAGLLSSVERKNCWWLAEQAGHRSPRRMQRLLGEAVWDAEAVRDDVRGVRRRPARPSGGGADLRRDRVRQERPRLGRCAAAVLRDRGPDREQPGRGVPVVCLPAGPGADRPPVVRAPVLDRRSRPVRGRRHPRRSRVRDQAAAGLADDRRRARRRCHRRVRHRRRMLRP